MSKMGMRYRSCLWTYPFMEYTTLLLESIARSIIAEVAMKDSILRLYAARVIPLMAPPVPNNPATKPETIPPPIELDKVGLSARFLKISNSKLVTIRKNERAISRTFVSMTLLRNAPAITKITAGTPIESTSFLSNPFLKKTIFARLLDT